MFITHDIICFNTPSFIPVKFKELIGIVFHACWNVIQKCLLIFRTKIFPLKQYMQQYALIPVSVHIPLFLPHKFQ